MQFVKSLVRDSAWKDVADRCDAIAEASAGLSGNRLKRQVYERLPELMERPYGKAIS
jgi:hypothetical protein